MNKICSMAFTCGTPMGFFGFWLFYWMFDRFWLILIDLIFLLRIDSKNDSTICFKSNAKEDDRVDFNFKYLSFYQERDELESAIFHFFQVYIASIKN